MFRIIACSVLTIIGAMFTAGVVQRGLKDAGYADAGIVAMLLVSAAGGILALVNGGKSTIELVDREFNRKVGE